MKQLVCSPKVEVEVFAGSRVKGDFGNALILDEVRAVRILLTDGISDRLPAVPRLNDGSPRQENEAIPGGYVCHTNSESTHQEV